MDSYGSDEELLYLMHCGYEEAETLLYKRYYRLIYRWIYPLASTHNDLDYNDYVQIAMMYLDSIFNSYRDDYHTSLRHFVKNAIVKKMVSFLRTRVKKKEEYYPSLNNWVDDEKKLRYDDIIADPKSYYQPEKVLAVKEASSYYYTAIDKLASQVEKEVIMYLEEGYSEQEIAEILNINIKSIYNAVYRIRKKKSSIDDLT